MADVKIVIGTPTRDGMIWGQTADGIRRLQRECLKSGIALDWATTFNEPYVQEGRNSIASKFLEGDGTHLLFIDSDVVFHPADVFALLEADKAVIAGIYPMKQINWDMVGELAKKYSGPMLDHVSCTSMFFLGHGEFKLTDAQVRGPVEVEVAATGFMLIQRQILERLKEKIGRPYRSSRNSHRRIWPFFELDYIDDPSAATPEDDLTRFLLGEDCNFCVQVKEMGEKIYVLPRLVLGHVGPHIFKGCPVCAVGDQIHSFKLPEAK